MVQRRTRQTVQVVRYRYRPDDLLTLEEIAALSDTTVPQVERVVRLDLLQPDVRQPRPRFRAGSIARLRRMLRLHYQLGVSWTSMGLVLDLLQQIDELDKELRALRCMRGGK